MTPTPAAAVVHLADPGELICAMPVMLGFRPRDSLVLAALTPGMGFRHRLGLTLRVDLPVPRLSAALAESAAESLLLGAPESAVVLVVGTGPDDRPRGRPARSRGRTRRKRAAGPPRRDVAQAAVAALRARGIAPVAVLWAQRFAKGAPWACYDGCCAGTLDDPSGTAIAAHAVADGQVLFGDRSELEALVAPGEPADLRRREVLLERAFAPVGTAATDGAAARADPAAAAALERLDDAVAATVRGDLRLTDDRIVALALDLRLPEVRDAAMRLCAGPDGAAAEQLWARLTRETPEPEAAVPAALLALCALLDGRGALANVALARAEQAWPTHLLTRLLRGAAAAGVHPEQVRAWLEA
jgi:hypothetical protein